jgi:hypothetical protein
VDGAIIAGSLTLRDQSAPYEVGPRIEEEQSLDHALDEVCENVAALDMRAFVPHDAVEVSAI